MNMVLGVKKKNLIVYVACLFLGALLIILSFLFKSDSVWKDIFIGLGCSSIPTALTAFFIERISVENEIDKRNKLRVSFLCGLPHGVIWIAKTIIEEYYPSSLADEISFIDAFKVSIENMEHIDVNAYDLKKYVEIRKNIINKLSYGCSLCTRDGESIWQNKYELNIDNIFSDDEMLAIRYLRDECRTIKNYSVICEMAECIKQVINVIYERIPEIKEKLDRKAIIENNRIKNWVELSK